MTTASVDRLQQLCLEYLDNADLDIRIDSDEFAIHLLFYPAGFDRKVLLNCADVRELKLTKQAVDRPFFAVMKTSVIPPQQSLPAQWGAFDLKVRDLSPYLWKVEVEGSLSLRISALRFVWREEQLSDEERAYLNTSQA